MNKPIYAKMKMEIKTTKEIHMLFGMNNYSEQNISNKKWVAVDDLEKWMQTSLVNEKNLWKALKEAQNE